MASPPAQFGVVVPGRPVLTDFQPLDASKAVAFLENPGEIEEITFFLLPSSPVPRGMGVVLYYSAPPFTDWQVLGAVFAEKASGTFRTGAAWKEQLRFHQAVQLGISLETMEHIENLQLGESGRDDRINYGIAVGKDLYNFLASFDQPSGSPPGYMVLPQNALDLWLKSFERRSQIDPNYVLKANYS
mmetsp:Transcript_28723/g.91967  ORF Transcript_28723/g.91967 Transcript_28723/m.91967 type:complete len:187 (-) Transcript_28723:100-660(-)